MKTKTVLNKRMPSSYFPMSFAKFSENHSTEKQKNIFQVNGRSSRSQMFFKIGVLKNFANFTGKHLCWSRFLMFPWFMII